MSRFVAYNPLIFLKADDYPTRAYVKIAVNPFASAQGYILITAQMVSENEIDAHVDQLADELEQARKEAKRQLRRTNRLPKGG